ncbi:unnamed protein product [Clonostachys solani]|uniref:Uncharacterized protein n=1 Tax=Clonostachys solani TaxID=160281 RepID=A0A9N9ZA84_9HYPO|nr:unnamed protein product [Clonostachys solani]
MTDDELRTALQQRIDEYKESSAMEKQVRAKREKLLKKRDGLGHDKLKRREQRQALGRKCIDLLAEQKRLLDLLKG